jgi:hypothetical protein
MSVRERRYWCEVVARDLGMDKKIEGVTDGT